VTSMIKNVKGMKAHLRPDWGDGTGRNLRQETDQTEGGEMGASTNRTTGESRKLVWCARISTRLILWSL